MWPEFLRGEVAGDEGREVSWGEIQLSCVLTKMAEKLKDEREAPV